MEKTLLLFIVFTFCISCDENDDPEDSRDTTRLIVESLKPYRFQTGSYWIFENDSSGTIDSVAVIETDSGSYWSPPPIHDAPGQQHEYFNIVLKNFTSSSVFNDYLDNSHIRRNGGGDFGELGQPIFIADGLPGDGYNGMEIVNIHKALELNGLRFTNVREVKITASEQYQQEFDHDTYLFFKDSVGIIKQINIVDQNDSCSWSLVRWNAEL